VSLLNHMWYWQRNSSSVILPMNQKGMLKCLWRVGLMLRKITKARIYRKNTINHSVVWCSLQFTFHETEQHTALDKYTQSSTHLKYTYSLPAHQWGTIPCRSGTRTHGEDRPSDMRRIGYLLVFISCHSKQVQLYIKCVCGNKYSCTSGVCVEKTSTAVHQVCVRKQVQLYIRCVCGNKYSCTSGVW
jgi:hypothetical protein